MDNPSPEKWTRLSSVDQVAAVMNDKLDEVCVDRRRSWQSEFVPIDFDCSVHTYAQTRLSKHAQALDAPAILSHLCV